MFQIAMAVVLVVVMSALALSASRAGRPALAAAVAAAGLMLGGGLALLAWRGDEALPPVPTGPLVVEFGGAWATGAGTRLEGTVENRGELAVSKLAIGATLSRCDPDGGCVVLGSAPVELLMHLGPGQRYPFTAMVRLEMPPNVPPETLRWELAVLSALGYADAR